MTDLRYALRTLKKNPGFTVVIILTLALGIGANTALFSVINLTLLRPLPYEESHRLVFLDSTTKTGGRMTPSYPDFLDYKKQQQGFEYLTGCFVTSVNFSSESGTERVRAGFVDHDFFRALRIRPQEGTDFAASDDLPGAASVALVSYEAWQQRFGGSPTLVGRQLKLAGRSVTVAGILPRQFRSYRNADFFLPLAPFSEAFYMGMRNSNYGDFHVMARLKTGVSHSVAQEEMSVIARNLAAAYPKSNTGKGALLTPMQERLGGGSRNSLYILLGAVTMVLLIACVNVANMLLSRACVREKEMALRAALGAGRVRLVRQLLTESLLLAGAGGVVGVLFGQMLFSSLSSLVPFGMRLLHAGETISLDWRVVFFSVLLSLVTGVAFGLAPAWQLSHVSPNDALKERSSVGLRRIGRFRVSDVLVVIEVALAAMLLIGSGLMIRSFWKLQAETVGFDVERVVALKIATPMTRLDNDWGRTQLFYEQAAESVQRLPGVESVGIVSNAPFSGEDSNIMFYFRDRPVPASGEFPMVRNVSVSPDYFKTMGIPLIQGRIFERTDNRPPIPTGKPDMGALLKVLSNFSMEGVVSQSFASQYWPDESPVGKVLRLGTPETPFGWVTIVGVVGDVSMDFLGQRGLRALYLNFSQWTPPMDFGLVVRAKGDPAALISSVREALRKSTEFEPVYGVDLQSKKIERTITSRRFNSQLFVFFSAVALVLSLVGIYGVVAFAVSRRTREFGIRIALGARQWQVLREVLLRGVLLVIPGIAIGLFAAWMLNSAIQSLLVGIGSNEPAIYAVVALLLFCVALLASLLPARRATQVDPAEALRAE